MSWPVSYRQPAKWEYFRVRTWQGYIAHVRVDGNCWTTRAFKKDFDSVVDNGGSLDAVVEKINSIVRPYSGAMRREVWMEEGEVFISIYNRDFTDLKSLKDPFDTSKHLPLPMDKEVFAVLRG